MSYLVAVLSDRMQAEAASLALEKENIKATIVGKGYKSVEELELLAPAKAAKRRARLMALWLIPFGFFAGTTFSMITGLDTFAWAGKIGSHLIGGLLAAASGALGSLFVGGGVGLIAGSNDALVYRNRLREGKYLIVVQGSETLMRQASGILRQFEPENIQQNYQ